MTAHHIVFLDASTLPVPLPAPAFPHTWESHPATEVDQVAERLRDATIAVTNKVPIRRETLAACPGLRLVAVAATGTDVVDLAACAARRVAVTNVRDYAGGAVAEHVFLVMMALRRNLALHQAAVASGAWTRSPVFCLHAAPIQDLEGSTLGLVGYGTLARSVHVRAEAFGMKVLVAERRGTATLRPGRVSFEEVLGQADVLSLHCPLTAETRHLIDAEALKRMKRDALLINTARGGLVEAEALLDALAANRLAGAALDVLDAEPPPAHHPLVEQPDPRLIVTPHVAWASQASMGRLATQLVAVIEAWERGEPRNRLV